MNVNASESSSKPLRARDQPNDLSSWFGCLLANYIHVMACPQVMIHVLHDKLDP